MDPAALRAEFPVLERHAYFNAGTNGPFPRSAAATVADVVRTQVTEGRWLPHFERRTAAQTVLREGYARLLACAPDDVALTSGTSEGLGKLLVGLGTGAGDEILTSDQEHPGLLGPLIAARRRGARIRTAPLDRLDEAVTPATTLIVCSHVGWLSGEVAPDLADAGVPVILDGAQGAGAVAVDVTALGCAAYAAAGQKWLCGADGTGLLYVAPWFRERVAPALPAYVNFAEVRHYLESELREDARAYDAAALPLEAVAGSNCALTVLEDAGWDAVHRRALDLAEDLVARLRDRGRTVGPRGETTLVSWEDPDPPAARARLIDAGVIVRDLPGTSYVRASVGAWNDSPDIERLLAAL